MWLLWLLFQISEWSELSYFQQAHGRSGRHNRFRTTIIHSFISWRRSRYFICSISQRVLRPEIIAHIIAVFGRLKNMKVSGHHVIHHQINLGANSYSSPVLNQSENVTEKHAISPNIFNGNLWYFYGKTQILVLLILHTRKWRLTYTV